MTRQYNKPEPGVFAKTSHYLMDRIEELKPSVKYQNSIATESEFRNSILQVKNPYNVKIKAEEPRSNVVEKILAPNKEEYFLRSPDEREVVRYVDEFLNERRPISTGHIRIEDDEEYRITSQIVLGSGGQLNVDGSDIPPNPLQLQVEAYSVGNEISARVRDESPKIIEKGEVRSLSYDQLTGLMKNSDGDYLETNPYLNNGYEQVEADTFELINEILEADDCIVEIQNEGKGLEQNEVEVDATYIIYSDGKTELRFELESLMDCSQSSEEEIEDSEIRHLVDLEDPDSETVNKRPAGIRGTILFDTEEAEKLLKPKTNSEKLLKN